MATLDDDLFGARASDKQAKRLSARKADKGGHSAYAITYALFRINLAMRYRRRGETRMESFRKRLMSLLKGRGEKAMS